MESDDSAIPSQVTTRPWIHVSSPNRCRPTSQRTVAIDINDFESLSSTVGKWLLFHSNKIQATCNLSYHDNAWATIRTIVTNSINTDIFGAKCSTSWQGLHAGNSSSNGVICCYTGDYRNKESVKRAGDYIRAAHTYPGDMYYKTDNATYAGAYRHTGNKAVSMYKHSPDNKMYERDPSNPNKWILVDF